MGSVTSARGPAMIRVCVGVLGLVSLCLTGCQEMLCWSDQNEDGLCKPQAQVLSESYMTEGPVAFSSGVAYLTTAADRVTLLKTSGSAATVEHVKVSDEPTTLQATPDGERLLVLSQEAKTLSVIDPVTRAQQVYPLGSPFNRLEVSEDSRFAIALYSANFDSSAIIRNNNEMAVIDLAQPPKEADLSATPTRASNPQIVTLRSFGSKPLGITFAPPFTIQGEERRLALVESENYVTLLELDGFDPASPGRNETVVRFVQDAEGQRLVPRQVLWTKDDLSRDDDMFAFVLLDGSDDIISLNLLPSEQLDHLARPRVRPSLNQLTGGRRPVSIALFDDLAGRKKLLALNSGTRDLSIIDVATSDTVLVNLESPVEQMLVFETINADTDRQEPFALLYNTNGTLRTVYFVELGTVEVRRTRAVDSLNLDSGVELLQQTEDKQKALIMHPNRRSFSVLNLERRAVTPVEALSPIADFAFSGQGDDRLVTVFAGQPYVGLTELNNSHPTPVRLDLPAVATEVVPRTDTIVVDHGKAGGGVTLLKLSEPTRESATMLEGFGLDGLLNVVD